MSLSTSLETYLAAQSTVTTLVATRTYSLAAPDGTALPYLVRQKISDIPGYTLTGPDGTKRARVAFSCFAASLTGADALADAIAALFNGTSGTMGGLVVQSAFIANRLDLSQPELSLYRVDVDVMFTYEG